MQRTHGFTLIELSIVLIIVGLIAGGIMVGRDMITAARIRMTIAQMEQYEAAVNTFRAKYHALPGDMSPEDADDLGFYPRTGLAGDGDNNGLISGASGGEWGNDRLFKGEACTFWADLSSAQMISGTYNSCAAIQPMFFTPRTQLKFVPSAKMGRESNIAVYGGGNDGDGRDMHNYFEILAVERIWGLTGIVGHMVLTPQEAYAFDSKLDDGLPMTGGVRATSPVSGTGSPQVYVNQIYESNPTDEQPCYDSVNNNAYYLTGPNSTLYVCGIRKRASF